MERRWEWNYPREFYAAEDLLSDSSLRSKLEVVRASLDNLYAGIAEKTPYVRKHYGSVITPSGIFIEASTIALPMPTEQTPFDSEAYPAYAEQVRHHHESKQYVVFAFNVATGEVSELRPLAIEREHVTEYLGGGIEITLPPNRDGERGAHLHLPQMEDDAIIFNGEPTQPIERVLGRLDD